MYKACTKHAKGMHEACTKYAQSMHKACTHKACTKHAQNTLKACTKHAAVVNWKRNSVCTSGKSSMLLTLTPARYSLMLYLMSS